MSKANPRYRRNNPLLPPPDHNIYRLRIYGTLEAQTTISVLYYADELAVKTATLTTCDALFQAIAASNKLLTAYKAACSNDWAMGLCLIDVPTSPELATYTNGVLGSGTAGSGHAPTTTAVVIAKYSGVKGQCGRGRVSLPAVLQSNITASVIASTAPYAAFLTEMQLPYTGGGHTFTPVIFSKGNRTTKQLGYTPMTKAVLRLTLGTVRRRKLGRGI